MKNRIAKSIVAIAATSLLLASLGVSAASTTHKCPTGQKWDTKTSACMAKPAKPAN